MSNAICCCKGCNSIGTVKLDSFRRGGRSIYLCEYHAYQKQGYSTRNNNTSGKAKVNPFTFGVEFETSHSTQKARVEIMQNGYIATSDCTVDVEYKSPIYQGLNALSKQAETFGRLIDEGELEVGDNCGTHTHVGAIGIINPAAIAKISNFYYVIFGALSDEMSNYPHETINLFGRYFTGYARQIHAGTEASAHTNFVNIQHAYTLEWRLVKFVNAKQYMQAVRFCKAATEAVINNFLAHYDDIDFDARRYPSINYYRRHKAEVTAAKLVKLFHKFADEM